MPRPERAASIRLAIRGIFEFSVALPPSAPYYSFPAQVLHRLLDLANLRCLASFGGEVNASDTKTTFWSRMSLALRSSSLVAFESRSVSRRTNTLRDSDVSSDHVRNLLCSASWRHGECRAQRYLAFLGCIGAHGTYDPEVRDSPTTRLLGPTVLREVVTESGLQRE